MGKGELHLPFVGVGDRDYSIARPHRASHPFPFLDYLPVGLKDALADAGERFATPVRDFCDQPVDTLRWIHWILMPRVLGPVSCDHDSNVATALIYRAATGSSAAPIAAFRHKVEELRHY